MLVYVAFTVLAVVTIWAVLYLVVLLLRRRHFGSRLVVRSPRLGILNLKGASASQIATEDQSALAPFFSSVNESAWVRSAR
jgi:hypothetical protein